MLGGGKSALGGCNARNMFQRTNNRCCDLLRKRTTLLAATSTAAVVCLM